MSSADATPSRLLPRDRRESYRCLCAGCVDSGAVVCGRLVCHRWDRRLALYLPTLALAEVRAVRPDAAEELAEVLGHSMIVLGELDAASARQVDRLLTDAGVFDAIAGHVVHVARQRGWPAT